MIWLKSRISSVYDHQLVDTTRGSTKYINSNLTNAESTSTNRVTAFNTNGFTLAGGSQVNESTGSYVSWTFREQPKFFDVVTYTGTGSARTIAHSLDSVPGCMIIKRTDDVRDWAVYHRSLGATKGIYLNSTAAEFTSLTALWNGTTPTSTEFSVGTNGDVNASGGTYVAYLFAHDAGGFGRTGTDNVISCGSFTTPSGSATSVNLGYEPQFVLFKATNTTDDWYIADNMRGFQGGSPTGAGNPTILRPNTSQAEGSVGQFLYLEPTGFNVQPGVFSVGTTFIYIAIRRGPMKTPTTGTSVFSPYVTTSVAASASGSTLANALYSTNFVVDMGLQVNASGTDGWYMGPRLAGNRYMKTETTAAEAASSQLVYDSNVGAWGFNSSYGLYSFRRAPGFFDVVCYTGNGTAGRTVTHNLGVAPELIIIKNRTTVESWAVYSASLGATKGLYLNGTNAAITSILFWNNTAPTSTVFSVSNAVLVNQNNANLVAYLFASCPGVSKVGSYTGTGTTLQIDCGFTGGARFVLIKRTDSTGDWYVWDSARGIVSGNDPYLLLNTSGAEVQGTDYVDTYSAGFEISSTAPAGINANGGTYLFLAIA
jgi:hypothetical protein